MINKHISDFRAFNRFYTVFIGILDRKFLNSKYSLPETRVLHSASTKPGVTSAEISSSLNIDKSYLSRMVLSLEKRKLLTKRRSESDNRSFNIYITEFGKSEFEKMNKASNDQVGKILGQLNENELESLSNCMSQIEQILNKTKMIK